LAPKKKKRRRRTFSKQFKADAVSLVRQSDKSMAEIARNLDLSLSALCAWVKQAEIDDASPAPGPLTSEERVELQKLRRDNKRLLMERDFLKKATAFFAQEDSKPSR
jgi:transposase-like protein